MATFDSDFNVIYIRVIQGCNLNCTHCFTLGDADPIMKAKPDDIQMYLDAIKKNVNPKKATVYIHGGETFLAPLSYLKDVNRRIRETFKGSRLDIVPQTNLTYKIDDEYVQFIKDEYRSTIGVSWDADIRFKNERQERQFFGNLKTLLDNDIRVHIAITAQRHLLKYDPIEIAKKFDGVDSLDFELLTTFDDKTRDLKPNNAEWAAWLDRLVEYYQHNPVTWSLPHVDLFTKSVMEGKIFDCKCNCCDHRTFTFNPNGTVGLCPDTTYIRPLSSVEGLRDHWDVFEERAKKVMLDKAIESHQHDMCFTCDHYDICGGNCESSLFDETDECPMAKQVVSRIRDNADTFIALFNEKAAINLTELRDNYHEDQ